MKIAEINKLIKKHIEPSLYGYTAHKDLLFKVESLFFLKYYCVVSTGNDENDLYISVAVQPLYVKSDFLYKTFGFNLNRKKRIGLLKIKSSELWDARKEHLDESFQSILKSILEQGEPFLSAINTSEEFYKKFNKEKKESISIYEAVAYSTVLFGNEDLQTKTIKGLIDFCTSQIDSEHDIVEMQIKKDATLLLNANTTEKRLLILECWANETIKHLKLPNVNPFAV